ncbi:MAG: alpha/beta fold hydrolase [Proteobacteria bacterium]|nr:alpha/beta fold hydrolase [Burkholderiales bacterium]
MGHATSWIDHFVGNFKWSNATLICKGMAPYGAVAIGEIDRIGDAMNARHDRDPDDPMIWQEEWSALAARLEARADAEDALGHRHTAGNYYVRAGNYWFTGERFVPPGEPKLALYRRALRCFDAGFERRYPRMERVEVPYEGRTLAARFLPSLQQTRGALRRAPTVVLFNGLDNCKEMSVLFAGLEFSARGWNTLAIDGPGQGESLRLRGIHTRHDYEVAGRAAYDAVAARADVDPARVAVMGYSFGGYYAPRIAAFDKRFAACVAFGAMHWSIHEWVDTIRRTVAVDATKSAQSFFQVPWVFGAADLDAALEMARRFDLTDVAPQIECPFLVLHGANDRIVPLDAGQRLYEAVGSRNKTLKTFSVEEGGAEHCQVDDRQMGVDYIADWLAANV